jgi:hypothetical protein
MKQRMKYRKRKLVVFVERMRRGLHIEYRETVEIPTLLRRREYKRAGAQMLDIVKMSGLVVLWAVPGGGFVVAAVLKVSRKIRPSAFQERRTKREQ